jgi:pilus assembly protein CpaB
MNKRRGFLLIVISLALAIGAAWVARNWVQARMSANGSPADAGMSVVVAAMEIPFATKVESRHLRIITLPRSAQVGEVFGKPEDVIGLISLQKIISGEILLKARFADRSAGSTLAAIVKPDMRAVTVRVDDVIGVAGFLMPGNHVDVVAARLVNQRAVTETVLHDLNVLAVDQSAAQDKDQPAVVRAVTLEVSPKDAETLVRAREEGKIQLTLRNPLDKNATEEVAAVTPPPAPRASKHSHHDAVVRPADNGVTIIRGTNVNSSASST